MSDIVNMVDGWHVATSNDRAFVYDLDIAERAELANPHDIRSTIAKAIEDGAIQVPAAAEDLDSPAFLVEQELIPMPGGRGMKKATAYRLNRAAALFVVTRLRTPKAVELTLAIVKVFDQVTSGRALAVAPAADARIFDAIASLASSVAALAETQAMVVASLRAISAGTPDPVAARDFSKRVTNGVRRYVKAQSNGSKSGRASWTSKAHTLLRDAVRYPSGLGRTWAAFPASRRHEVETALADLVSTAEKAAGGRAQLTLVPQPPADPKSGVTGTGGE